jgi:hypothetical protein
LRLRKPIATRQARPLWQRRPRWQGRQRRRSGLRPASCREAETCEEKKKEPRLHTFFLPRFTAPLQGMAGKEERST